MEGVIQGFGVTHAALVGVLQLFINSSVLWFVVNMMMPVEGARREPFHRCILVVLLLSLVTIMTFGLIVVAGFFLPGFLVMLGGLAFWYLGSKAVVEGLFERHEGGLTILVLYWLTLVAVAYMIRNIV